MVNRYPIIIIYKFWNKSQRFFSRWFPSTVSHTHTHTPEEKPKTFLGRWSVHENESKTMGPLALWHFGLSKDWWKKRRSYFFLSWQGQVLGNPSLTLQGSCGICTCQDMSRYFEKPQAPSSTSSLQCKTGRIQNMWAKDFLSNQLIFPEKTAAGGFPFIECQILCC